LPPLPFTFLSLRSATCRSLPFSFGFSAYTTATSAVDFLRFCSAVYLLDLVPLPHLPAFSACLLHVLRLPFCSSWFSCLCHACLVSFLRFVYHLPTCRFLLTAVLPTCLPLLPPAACLPLRSACLPFLPFLPPPLQVGRVRCRSCVQSNTTVLPFSFLRSGYLPLRALRFHLRSAGFTYHLPACLPLPATVSATACHRTCCHAAVSHHLPLRYLPATTCRLHTCRFCTCHSAAARSPGSFSGWVPPFCTSFTCRSAFLPFWVTYTHSLRSDSAFTVCSGSFCAYLCRSTFYVHLPTVSAGAYRLRSLTR